MKIMKFWLIPFGMAQNVPHFGTVWQMCNYKFVGIWYPIFAPSRCEDANPLQVAIESMVSLFQDFESLSEQQLSAEFCDYSKVGQSEKHAFKDYESVHTIQVWVSVKNFGPAIWCFYICCRKHPFIRWVHAEDAGCPVTGGASSSRSEPFHWNMCG